MKTLGENFGDRAAVSRRQQCLLRGLIIACAAALAACTTASSLTADPEAAAQARQAKSNAPRIHLPRGGMQTQPMGSTDVFVIDGEIQTRVEGGNSTSSASGRSCVPVGGLLRCD